MKKSAYAVLSLAFLFLFLYASNLSPWRIGYNRTESIPLGFYVAVKMRGLPARGDTVCFKFREPAWAARRYLPDGAQICKEVLGLPGDTIRQTGDGLALEYGGSWMSLGTILHQDSKGRPVPPQNWGVTQIPPGKYYLGSLRIRTSFDSRYLGLVERSDILERVYPIFTF